MHRGRKNIAVLLDSCRWHGGRLRFASDLATRNALIAMGWYVLHVTNEMVTKTPRELVAQLKDLIARRHAEVAHHFQQG
ncbi:MAG: hypothetical protein ACT4TC_04955 [Myxococcaceae bacterium]